MSKLRGKLEWNISEKILCSLRIREKNLGESWWEKTLTRGGIKCIIVGTSASMVSFYFSLFFIFKFLKPLCKTKGKEGRVLVFENPVSHRSLKIQELLRKILI